MTVQPNTVTWDSNKQTVVTHVKSEYKFNPVVGKTRRIDLWFGNCNFENKSSEPTFAQQTV